MDKLSARNGAAPTCAKSGSRTRPRSFSYVRCSTGGILGTETRTQPALDRAGLDMLSAHLHVGVASVIEHDYRV
jgi:hypothetical protein